MEDIFVKETGLISIIVSIWAFVSPLLAILKLLLLYLEENCGTTYSYDAGFDGETHYVRASTTRNCNLCCPCEFPFTLLKILPLGMMQWDDPAFLITNQDYKVISKTLELNSKAEELELKDLNLEENQQAISKKASSLERMSVVWEACEDVGCKKSIFVRMGKGILGCVALPSLVNQLSESSSDPAKIARIFTFGAPIIQELGINVLSLANYTSFVTALSCRSPRTADFVNKKFFTTLYTCWSLSTAITSYYYAGQLNDPIEKLFSISIMTIRTFGGIANLNFYYYYYINCNGIRIDIDLGHAFCAGINLWYAVQNAIWAFNIDGVNLLDPSVKLWRPF
jgi:hypothetical protein